MGTPGRLWGAAGTQRPVGAGAQSVEVWFGNCRQLRCHRRLRSEVSNMSDPSAGSTVRPGTSADAAAASVKDDVSRDAGRWSRLRHQWRERLDPAEQSAVMSWAAFTIVFAGLRTLTHWIRGGHGPKSGGISLGGRHFHHYDIGIALLAGVGAVGLRGSEKQRRHPAVAVHVRVGGCARRRRTRAVVGLGRFVLGFRRPKKRGLRRSASSRQEQRSSPGYRSGRTRTVRYGPTANPRLRCCREALSALFSPSSIEDRPTEASPFWSGGRLVE
jgi:hypothetical protein